MPRGGDRSKQAAANGKRVGRTKNKPESANKARATAILDGLALTDEEWKAKGHSDRNGQPCECEDCLWRKDCKQPYAAGREARTYLWNRRDGKPAQLHRIEGDVNLNLAARRERIRELISRLAGKAGS